jgi:chromate transporter
LARTLRTAAWWAALWWAPIGALALLGLGDTLYVAQGVSHGAVAALSFGGAYAALAWASQGALAHGWVTSGHVVDSMGLAESTPGPLILVLPLLAFIGAHHAPAGLPPLLGGVLAATLSLWMIFVPSFMWIFAGAPWIEALARCARIASATRLVGAVAVGLVAALALGVAMHTWFGATTRWDVGDHVRVEAPTWPTVRAPLIALSLAALVALQRKVSVGVVLLAGAGLTLALGALAPARLS